MLHFLKCVHKCMNSYKSLQSNYKITNFSNFTILLYLLLSPNFILSTIIAFLLTHALIIFRIECTHLWIVATGRNMNALILQRCWLGDRILTKYKRVDRGNSSLIVD